jgi:hypothetical protein
MPSVVQRGTESFRIRSVAPVDVPSTRRRNVPEGRWVLREGFSTETTRIPPTTPATQRRTCSLGNAAVRARQSMKRSITARLVRGERTTNRLGDGTSRGCVPTSSARIRVVAPCATVKHSRQTLFRSRSRCACSSRLSTLSSAVTTSRAWPNGRQAAFTDARKIAPGVQLKRREARGRVELRAARGARRGRAAGITGTLTLLGTGIAYVWRKKPR